MTYLIRCFWWWQICKFSLLFLHMRPPNTFILTYLYFCPYTFVPLYTSVPRLLFFPTSLPHLELLSLHICLTLHLCPHTFARFTVLSLHICPVLHFCPYTFAPPHSVIPTHLSHLTLWSLHICPPHTFVPTHLPASYLCPTLHFAH